jgi:hypothetical protein
MNGVMDKPVVDVYSKYSVTGMNWRLEGKDVWRFKGNGLDSESVGLGEYMHYALVKGRGDSVDNGVIDNALYFKGVEKYYVRDSMSAGLFRLFSGIHIEDKVFEDAWGMYNRDPWDRRFPNFVNGTVMYTYDNLSSDVKLKYGYWVYYKDRVMSSDYKNDIRHNIRYIDDVPLLILHTTTIEGFVVACLDVVGVNKI